MAWTLEEFWGPAPRWDSLAAQFDDFTPMQSYAWAEARASEGWSVRRDLWRDEAGEVVAAATSLARQRFALRIRYMSRGPLILRRGLPRTEAQRVLVTCIAEYRRRLGWGEILVCSLYPTLAEIGPEAIAGSGLRPLFPRIDRHAFSSIVPVSDADAWLDRASSDWRNRLHRSEALLADVRQSDSLDVIRRARRLVAGLERDKGFSTSMPDGLLRGLSASGARVFYLEDATGDMTAAVLVAVAGRRAFRVMAGVAPEEIRKHPGAGRVLEVAVTRWCHGAGLADYDLEGLDPANRGVWDFKAGMRGTMFASAGLHAVSRPRALAAALSYYRRRGWTTMAHLARTSPGYFVATACRLASRGRLDARRMVVYRKRLDEGRAGDNPPGFTFAVLDELDPELFRYRLSTVRDLWSRIEALRKDENECGVVWARDGYAAAYGFLRRATAPLPELGVTLPLGSREGYIYDCFVLPQFRGRRLYPFLLRQICAHARRRGLDSALIAVDAANVPSARGIEAAGFRRHRSARYHRFGPLSSLAWEGEPS